MNSGIGAFLLSAGIVALAEMGDKTQLLVVAFVAKCRVSRVIAGAFGAIFLNQALAVAAGSLIAGFEVAQVWVNAIAALSFIFFGLWTLKKEDDELSFNQRCNTGLREIFTVFAAFFAAELGDKTQLATIALAARFPSVPAEIFAGTTIGMLAANFGGICVGAAIIKRIPERIVKFISAGAFILFGFISVFQTATGNFGLSVRQALAVLAALVAATGFMVYFFLRKSRLCCR